MRHFCNASFILFLLCVYSYSNDAHGRNLSHRLGVGYTNQIATHVDKTIPAMSSKYFLSKTTALGLGLGFDTRTSDSTLGIGLKGYQNLFTEENLNFYTGLGLAYVSRQGGKMQVSAYFGTEIFLAGLPSLGLSLETGIRGDSTTGSFAVRTTGDSFLTAGAHFYF